MFKDYWRICTSMNEECVDMVASTSWYSVVVNTESKDSVVECVHHIVTCGWSFLFLPAMASVVGGGGWWWFAACGWEAVSFGLLAVWNGGLR